MRPRLFVLLAIAALAATGCANVKPYERGYLARQEMQFDPDPIEARFTQHIYGSKEGAHGGYGVGGGGCGCN